jgi:ATP-binding protein involved in chromosome partitioning
MLGMIENMTGDVFGRGGVRRKAEQLGVPFLGEVPLDVSIRERGDEGLMRTLLDPGSSARASLLNVVEQLAQQISIHNIKTPKFPTLEILN